MNFSITDIVVLALVLIVAIVYLVKGFVKAGLNDIMLVGIIVGAVFLTPIIVKKLQGLEFIIGISENLTESLKGLGENFGATLTDILVKAVVVIVLILLLWLVSKLLKLILRKILKPKRKFGKALDKIFGMIFGVALYGTIFLGLVGSIATVQNDAIQADIEKSYIQQYNPLAEFCEKNLNLGEFILSFNQEEPSDENGEGQGAGSGEQNGGEEQGAGKQ